MNAHNYDHLLGFDLSSDFHIIKDVDDDGKPTFGIGFGQSVNDNGEITYEHSVNVIDAENKENNDSNVGSSSFRLKGNIENTVNIRRQVKSFFGLEIVITVAIIVLHHKEKTYVLNSVLVGDGEKATNWIKFINDVLFSVILDGKKGGFSPITEDMIQQGSSANNNPNANEEMAQFTVEDIATLEYSNDRYTTAGGVFKLPVPDGYHYGSNDGVGNENWFYIVPDNVPLNSNHIDAKPFSFAITTVSVGQLPFDMQKVEGYRKALVQVGALSGDTWADVLILSSNCAFFYQCWTDTSEYMYHKMNGLLLTGTNAYQFHVFANYDAPIAADAGALYKFLETALSWMGKVSRIGDSSYKLENIDACKSAVTDFIDRACGLVAQSKNLLGITMDFDTELRKHFVMLGALLYRHHNIALTYSSVAQIANMVGQIEGRALDVAAIQGIINGSEARFGNIHDYLESFSVTALVKQLVKLDKMVKADSEEGISHFYFDTVELFLRLLCLENGISFSKSDYYIGCKVGARLIIGNVWDSINIEVFSGGTSTLGNFAGFGGSSSSVGNSGFGVHANTGRGNGVIEYPRCKVIPKTQCEIDFMDTLTEYSGSGKNIAIPDNVTTIGRDAFYGKSDLKTVVIPDSVTEIEDDAFWSCRGLEHIILPGSLDSIGANAFRDCGMQYVIIPDGVTQIGADAFTSCKELKDIYVPASVWSIGDDAFYTFNDNTVIHTPPGSEAEQYAIDHNMSYDHKSPPTQRMAAPKEKAAPKPRKTESSDTPGQDFGKDFNVTAAGTLQKYKGKDPKIVIPEGVKKIGASVFLFNDKITEVVIPEGVTHIGDKAFMGCRQLKSVSLPQSIKVIGASAFYCSGIESIDLPEKITEIQTSTFSACRELKKVVIPNAVKTIGFFAFSDCDNLEEILIPDSVQEITAEYAFQNCPKLVIKCRPGSYAEKYAIQEKIPYKDSRSAEEIAAEKAEKERQERLRREAELEAKRKAAEEAERRRKEAERREELRREAVRIEEERRRKAAEEAELRRQRMLAEQRARYNELSKNIAAQEQVIAENKGWFGAQAKARKEAKEQLSILQAQLAREFPNGRP